jgi:transcriptional regulator NrdR family protein
MKIIGADLCDRCGGDSKVLETRSKAGTPARRRACLSCGERWTSWEVRLTAENFGALKQAVKLSRH